MPLAVDVVRTAAKYIADPTAPNKIDTDGYWYTRAYTNT